MTGSELLREIGEARELPREAIVLCLLNVDAVAPGILEVVEAAAAGRSLSPNGENLLFYGLHILGGAKDKRLFAPLMRLLRRPENELETLLGDVLTEGLPRIVIGCFDGNAAGLFDFIADPAFDGMIRSSCLDAVTFLTWEGRIDADVTRAFLERFDNERLAEDGEFLWWSWSQAVELLAWRDLAPRVEAAYRDNRMPFRVSTLKDFHKALAAAERAEPADDARFRSEHLGYIDDVIEELEKYPIVLESDNRPMMGALDKTDFDFEPGVQMPVRNPMRHVGRNDPCPCGSGKKAKRCCLAVA